MLNPAVVNIETMGELRGYMRRSGVDVYGSVNVNEDLAVWVKLTKQSLAAVTGESPDSDPVMAFYSEPDNAVYLG